MLSAILRCEQCDWQTVCSQAEIESRLRQLGLLRRAKHPQEEMVRELLGLHLSRLVCDGCGAVGLLIAPVEDAPDDGDWQQAVVCEVCHEVIPEERLEVFPNAKRCVKCQNAEERGETVSEWEYCPKCGAVLELRVSRSGGVTRYKQFCTGSPPCRL